MKAMKTMSLRAGTGSPGRLTTLREKLRSAQGWRGKFGVIRALTSERWSATEQRDVIAIPMVELGGERIYVRPQTTDLSNASAYFAHGIHLPPPVVKDPRRIVELGTNMGAGLTALALEYPKARPVGVEPDAGNFAVAQLNAARFSGRVELIRAAVWDREAELVVDNSNELGAHGLTIRPATAADAGVEKLSALTIDQLLDRAFPGEEIDYMHVTIEGTEPLVFAAGGEWPRRVRALRVEAHPYFGYPAEECIRQLRELGYEAEAAPHPPDKWVFAWR